jgi:hypothetical protein
VRTRIASVVAVLPCLFLSLAACGAGEEQALEPDDQYTQHLEGVGVIPAHLSGEEAIRLGHDLCARYERGETFVDILADLSSTGTPGPELGSINEAATAAYCPEYAPTW